MKELKNILVEKLKISKNNYYIQLWDDIINHLYWKGHHSIWITKIFSVSNIPKVKPEVKNKFEGGKIIGIYYEKGDAYNPKALGVQIETDLDYYSIDFSMIEQFLKYFDISVLEDILKYMNKYVGHENN